MGGAPGGWVWALAAMGALWGNGRALGGGPSSPLMQVGRSLGALHSAMAATTDERFHTLGEDDNYYSEFISSNCYVPTPSNYEGVNVTNCAASNYLSSVEHPNPACVSDESELAYSKGQFSAIQTFYNCLANVDSPSMPTFYNGTQQGCSFLYTTITPVNLLKIDELSGTARMQIIVNFIWNDFRYNMSLFWQNVNAGQSGVDLTKILTNQSVVMWLPEVTFPDASDLTMQSQTLSMLGPFVFFYSVSYDMTLVQPTFNFRKYPRDTQNIVIRYSALNYDAADLQMYPLGVYCSYLQDGSCSFSQNPIWTYRPQENYCTVYYDQRENSFWQSITSYTLSVERSPRGVTIRLVVPLALLILLSGLTFWIAYEHRVDVTITLLLAISALYIVIIQNVPLVGYLTTVDKFVFSMFMLLCGVAVLHQVYFTVHEKVHVWPLRLVYLRLIELFGRTMVVPIVCITFSETVRFNSAYSNGADVVGLASFVSFLILVRECFGVATVLHVAMEKVIDKIHASAKLEDVSVAEAFAVNMYVFQWWSTSKARIATYPTLLSHALSARQPPPSGRAGHVEGSLSSEVPSLSTIPMMVSMDPRATSNTILKHRKWAEATEDDRL